MALCKGRKFNTRRYGIREAKMMTKWHAKKYNVHFLDFKDSLIFQSGLKSPVIVKVLP